MRESENGAPATPSGPAVTAPDLTITAVSIYRGGAPGRDRVELRTAGGLAGSGEGAWCESVLCRQPELVVGRSPFEVEAIFEEVSAGSGETPGGLDIALWDLAGKALERPVHELLGKTYRTKVLACASVADATQAPEFRAIRLEADRVDFVRETRPNTHVGLRLTAATVEEALSIGERLEEVPLEFWESPVAGNDAKAYRRLKDALRVPIAAGPSIPLDAVARDYIQAEAADLVIQDIGAVGLTGMRRLAYFGWLFRVRLAPCCSVSPLGIGAALHAAACIAPASNALNAPPVFFITDGVPRIELSGGFASVPRGPGLGVESGSPGREPDLTLGGEAKCFRD